MRFQRRAFSLSLLLLSPFIITGCGNGASPQPIIIRVTATSLPDTGEPKPSIPTRSTTETLAPQATATEAPPATSIQAPPENPTTSPATTGLSTGISVEISITMRDFGFTPAELSVPYGSVVHLELRNVGNYPHDILIPELGVYVDVPSGETTSVEFVADKMGRHAFLCTKIDPFVHHENGMEGSLSVEAAP